MELTLARQRTGTASFIALVALLGAMTSGCGSGERAADSPRAAGSVQASTPAGGEAIPDCPRNGHWSDCHVRERIRRAGLAPRDTAELDDLPEVGHTPVLLRVGKSGLALYLFPDSVARARAARQLDTVRFLPAARPLTMQARAVVIENDNLLAILFSKNEHQIERVSDAIMAGPPQPSGAQKLP